MAMVLDAFASYLQSMLTEMAAEEVHMLLGVSTEIDKMTDKLKDLKNFLADADRRNITDKSVQEWVGQLKRAMYEGTDILDLCQLKAMEGGPSTVDGRCFSPLLFCMLNPSHAHDIGSRIKELNKKLGSIKERGDAFNFANLGSYEDLDISVQASRYDNLSRETSGEFDRLGVVGEKIKEDTRALVEIILTEEECNANIMVVAIVGVGGIGKTTLAQKVFNDETINSKFDKLIWLSINQNFDKVELIKTIITLAGGETCGGTVLAVLQPILTTALAGKKVLLVLDDVWSHKAWGGVLESTLANVVARGSRVLVTTRDERVARGMKAVLPYHNVDKLEEKDAWSLLKKQVVSNEKDEQKVDMLKYIGLRILAKCDGLPLAVKVMGGLLCQKDINHREWEMVLDDSVWSVSEMPEELNHAVYLSYKDLPSCIKQCFLYYSILPKTALFYRDDIIGMWIGEGFIHGTTDDLEGLGRKYYTELIMRNLIEPNTQYIDQCICNMHDVVRSFAQFVARDETLAAHGIGTNIVSKLGAQKFLRLSLESKESESDGLHRHLQAQKALRTLISVGHINIKPGDSLVQSPCLRTLHIGSANVLPLLESLNEFKHLRYLSFSGSRISSLPDSIGEIKFLQHICLRGCKEFVKLPHSIVKLRELRHLNFSKTSINGIPRGFCVLTNLRILSGFPARVDGDWCSLEELGPLSRLKRLGIEGLENVIASLPAAKTKLGEKVHLTNLRLSCSSRMGDNGLVECSEEEQQHIEEVFDKLCPPPSLDYLAITGYFGRHLPRWMMSSSVWSLNSLRILMAEDLACCTQLPDGLCQLPYLEFIQIHRAPAIKRIGHEFLQSYHPLNHHHSQAVVAFPRLHTARLMGMVGWEEWKWEEQVRAFPVLNKLILSECKLRRLPPGLASQARALNVLSVQQVKGLICLENITSLVELQVIESLDLERITNLPRLQKLTITNCPKLKVLEGVPALQRLVLEDGGMETLPEYIGGIIPMRLELYCRVVLLASMADGQSGPEWDKFSHVEHVNAYAREGDNPRKWYVLYTANPYNLETNVSLPAFMSRGTLSSSEDARRFESVFKMTRKTFSYICSLVKVPLLDGMDSYTFVDGRVLSLQDRVAVALRRLNSSESTDALGSSVGVNKSTILLVTEKFVAALREQAFHHLRWPESSKMDKIKLMFDKIHHMPNCCGVIYKTHIPFEPNYNLEKNYSLLMQVVVDPEMRFSNISMKWPGSINLSSLLHDTHLFKECEKGAWLNGSKLKVALDGSEVGEYIIGDAGYPLLPWVLTPYQEEDLSDSEAEFNMRHSAATGCASKALIRFKDTWKYLQGETWRLINPDTQSNTIYACCMLHNIVIDMVDDAAMPRAYAWDCNYHQQLRQLANEDAIMARDMLSRYFLTGMSYETGGTLYSLEDVQRFESVFKMTRKTFRYICNLLNPEFNDMKHCTFVDGRVLSLQDQVAIALRRLYSSEPPKTFGLSFGVNESTVLLVTERFVHAVFKRAMHHLLWPDSSEMDKIKSMFENIHNMPNCCGVICTTHIPFGSNCNHKKNDCTLAQVVVGINMRFTSISGGWAGTNNQLSTLHDSELFQVCEKGARLNGSKLKVALDGSEVGEYIIGDAGYPFLPWLLTPYQEEDLSDAKLEFNRRHSTATTYALKALTRFHNTWKCLQGDEVWPVNQDTATKMICVCFILHNIVIDMENDAAMQSVEEPDYCEDVRQLANEDASRTRDMLSRYFLTRMPSTPGVAPVGAEKDHEVAATGSGDVRNEQEVQTRSMTDDIISTYSLRF